MLNEERTRGDFLKPYLRVFDVQWDSINTEDLPQMNFPPSAQVRYQLKPGDLLVNEGGSYVGRSAIWRGEIEECYYQKALHRLRARDPSTETAEFFLFVMEMATQVGVFVAEGNQTTIDHLTAEQLRATRVAFPPPLEQKAIAEYLQRETANLLALIEEIASAIALLQERRSALISATVTGKIDVRGQVAEAKAPEEAAAA
jgi:type I restriction enzyme S subunit